MDEAPAQAARPEAAGPLPRPAGEVRLPAASLRRLTRLCGELGSGGVAALREAGRIAGRQLVDGLSGAEEAGRQGLTDFFDELRGATAERGYGVAEYELLAGGVGRVELRGSPEAASGSDARRTDTRPGCHFAAGWLCGSLSAAAGEPVAVLEVSCGASPENDRCRFVVGAEPRLRTIRASLRAGASLEEALEDR